MSSHKINNRYDEEFKKSIVALHQDGKSQSQMAKEYGISMSARSKWIKQSSKIKTDDGEILTARQINQLQKRNAHLEEEHLILNKRPYSRHTQAAIRCPKASFRSAFCQEAVPCFESEPQHLPQALSFRTCPKNT